MKTESTRNADFTTIKGDVQLILGCVLAFASTGMMVMTLQSLMHGLIPKALAVMAGIALQGCLYLFANSKNHRIRFFSWLLMAFSVIASTWFMDATWQQQQNKQAQENRQKNEQSWQAEQIRNEIKELNDQISIALNSANTDASSKYGNVRQRSVDTMASLEDMREDRNKLMDQLKELTATSTTQSEQSVFEEYPPLRISLFALISTIIDVSAILAFGSLELNRKKPVTPVYWHELLKLLPQHTAQQPAIQHPAPIEQPEPTPEPEPKPDYLASILAKIRKGEYGEFVPVKQIVESEPIRHPELKAGIDQLIEEGVLTKSGNRYRHVGFEKQPELCMS